ncbi:sensor histidine kinase [Paraflavitalea soli]|uniref:Sensor histidine kinase n=1 Tax=Paraflavitalea soli TaxID=2315862 RepID=A0A3B7MS03_9BACT|nr:histidine kinase [Paraflavitalea soli]AXY76079.1 sensor histidine kinase [Paraflavitalea soli]
MATSPLGTNKNKLIFAGCWLVWSIVQVALLQNWQLPWPVAVMDAAVSNFLLAGICLLVSNNMRYYRPRKGKYIYILVLCAAVSGLWVLAVKFALQELSAGDEGYLSFVQISMPIRFTIALLATGCMSLISELWYAQEEQKETEQRSIAASQLAKDAELYKLRQQLQPHFLFNSLNSISALVTSRPEQARKMIQQLSDFLRGTLKKEENQWITLEEELQHLELYLDIEKVRFGHRLHTELVYGEGVSTQRIPHMLLQPVVENAIKFGLYDTTGDVTITLSALVMDGYLQITVSNPFDRATSSPRQGTGFGLNSVQRRLYLLFARNDLLTTTADGDLFTTTIKIPHI